METPEVAALGQMTSEAIRGRLQDIEQKRKRTPNQITPEDIVEEKQLREIEQKRLAEVALTKRNDDVQVVRAHGVAIADRINAKLTEIVEKDLVALHEVLKKLSELGGMPGSLANDAAAELRTALKSGSLTNVERRLIDAGWSHRLDVVELPIRSLRPPGEHR